MHAYSSGNRVRHGINLVPWGFIEVLGIKGCIAVLGRKRDNISVLEGKGIITWEHGTWNMFLVVKGDNISVLGWEGDHDIGTWNMAIVYCIMKECPYISGRKSVPAIVAVNWENGKDKTTRS
nr:hypothetical protein [Tanacetum cinerariifolium]